MKKYIRIELIDNDKKLENVNKDKKSGILLDKNILTIDNDTNLLSSDISINSDMVDNFIKKTYISTIGEKTTLVRVVLKNDFEIVESSSCVDKKNYSEKMGTEICLEKIKDKIYMLLGFLLQTAYKGFK